MQNADDITAQHPLLRSIQSGLNDLPALTQARPLRIFQTHRPGIAAAQTDKSRRSVCTDEQLSATEEFPQSWEMKAEKAENIFSATLTEHRRCWEDAQKRQSELRRRHGNLSAARSDHVRDSLGRPGTRACDHPLARSIALTFRAQFRLPSFSLTGDAADGLWTAAGGCIRDLGPRILYFSGVPQHRPSPVTLLWFTRNSSWNTGTRTTCHLPPR